MVERVAIALWNAGADDFNNWDTLSDDERNDARKASQAAIKATGVVELYSALEEVRKCLDEVIANNEMVTLPSCMNIITARNIARDTLTNTEQPK